MYGIPLMICLIIGIAATACLQTFKSPRAQYGLTFLLGVGMFPAAPLLIAWVAANLQPVTKRGVGIGIVIAMASCGGVLGSFIFAPEDAKTTYQTGHFALMICILGSFLISKFFVVYFRMHAFSQPPIEESLTRYLSLTVVERFEEDLKGDRAMVRLFLTLDARQPSLTWQSRTFATRCESSLKISILPYDKECDNETIKWID